MIPAHSLTQRPCLPHRLVPVSVALPVRICVCVKGVSPPCIRATVLVVKQEPIAMPGDIALLRQHAALAGVSGRAELALQNQFPSAANGRPAHGILIRAMGSKQKPGRRHSLCVAALAAAIRNPPGTECSACPVRLSPPTTRQPTTVNIGGAYVLILINV